MMNLSSRHARPFPDEIEPLLRHLMGKSLNPASALPRAIVMQCTLTASHFQSKISHYRGILHQPASHPSSSQHTHVCVKISLWCELNLCLFFGVWIEREKRSERAHTHSEEDDERTCRCDVASDRSVRLVRDLFWCIPRSLALIWPFLLQDLIIASAFFVSAVLLLLLLYHSPLSIVAAGIYLFVSAYGSLSL